MDHSVIVASIIELTFDLRDQVDHRKVQLIASWKFVSGSIFRQVFLTDSWPNSSYMP